MTHILVLGAYGDANIGDDLLLQSVLNFIDRKYPESIVTIHSTERSYHSKLFRNVSFSSELGDLAAYDLFIWGGGTQFFDLKGNRLKSFLQYIRFKLGLDRNHYSLCLKEIIRCPQKKGVILGLGVGPFLNKSFQEFICADIFKEMDQVYIRDVTSSELMQKWDISNYRLIPDLVFNQFDEKRLIKPSHRNNKLGIIVRDWPHNENSSYINNIRKAYEDLGQDFDVQYILFSKYRDSDWIQWLEDQNMNYLLWEPDIMTFEDFFTELNQFDFFISARFHGVILAALLGKPTIAINIDPKLKMIQQQLGMQEFVVSSPYHPSDFIDLSGKVINNFEKISDCILERVSTLKQELSNLVF